MNIVLASLPQSSDPYVNCQHIIEVIQANPSRFICFSETSLSGETKMDEIQLHMAIANAAREQSSWVIFGGYRTYDAKTFNEIYVIDSEGLLQHTYKKVHLFKEPAVMPGKREDNKVLETPIGRVAVINCWDISDPVYVRDLAEQGAEIIICSAYWFNRKTEFGTDALEHIAITRALENQVFFAVCDAHDEVNMKSIILIDPRGDIVEFSTLREGIIETHANISRIEESRGIYDCYPKRNSNI